MPKTTRKGFTIVELLIVIVVIGILAAITIVAYNGIQERARLASAQAFASQVTKRDMADAIGYWTFDECSGTTVKDSSGNGTNAAYAISGTVGWSTDTPSGGGCSLSFNSTTYINTGITLSNNYYLKAAWIKTSAPAGAMNIISSAVASPNGSALYLNNFKLATGHNNAWSDVMDTKALNDGKWHYVAAEYTKNASGTNGTMKLYVDGTMAVTNASIPLMNDPNDAVSIGSFGTGSRFSGLIDNPLLVVR